MIKFIITTVGLCAVFSVNAQSSYSLSGNNISATISNNGLFFNSGTTGENPYEIPKDSGNGAIYTMGFWFGGRDLNGQLKLAAETYTPGSDFYHGAISALEPEEAPETPYYGDVYPVTKLEIEQHIENVGTAGYVTPSTILNWPGNGDVSFGFANKLAPFMDLNGNGNYDPELGDYPKIMGDRAAYLILNDKGWTHGSGGQPIGAEIHYLFYQYETEDYLNNITFINVRVINRSTQTLTEFKTGCFVDPDLGDGLDDRVGFNAENNVMYVYNADNEDAEYGENPPALGIVLLKEEAHAFATFDASSTATGTPGEALDYWNYLDGNWRDGSSFTQGGDGFDGTEETNFMFNGNPNIPSEWSEVQADIPTGDRRMMMSVEEEVLSAHEILCYDYAIVYSREGDYLENVNGVIDLAGQVKSFYDSTVPYCESGFLGLENPGKRIQPAIFPNPSKGQFTVQFDGEYSIDLYRMDGRLVHQRSKVNGEVILQTNLSKGTYLLVLTQEEKKYQSKILVQ